MIEKACKEKGVPLFVADRDSGYPLSLSGEYQKENGAIAVLGAKTLGISEEHIKTGLLSAKWIARFEYLRDNLILDGGHNPDGIRALISSLKALNKPVHFVVAMMQDKDTRDVCRQIKAFAKSVTITEVNMPRCEKAENFAEIFGDCFIQKKSIKAIEEALLKAEKNELVCVCGSLYLAGEIRSRFIS